MKNVLENVDPLKEALSREGNLKPDNNPSGNLEDMTKEYLLELCKMKKLKGKHIQSLIV